MKYLNQSTNQYEGFTGRSQGLFPPRPQARETALGTRLALDYPLCHPKKNFPEGYIINPFLAKLVSSRWLDIGLVLSFELMDLDSVSVHEHAKKELGQYPAILTSRLVSNPYV